MPLTQWTSRRPRGARFTTTNGSAQTAVELNIATNQSCNIVANIIATDATTGLTGTTAGYQLIATFENANGTVTQVGSTTSDHSAEDIANPMTVAFAISGTKVQLNVTGDPGRTIRWSIWYDINWV